MESEPHERRAAVRAMLVEQVEATTPAPRPSSSWSRTPSGEPGRLRMAIVTGAVGLVVTAATVVALELPHPAGGHAAAPAAPTERASETPTPTDTPTPARTLIAPDGWHELTRAELHAYVVDAPVFQDDAANAAIWEEQAWLDIQCMATHGFLYDPVAQAESPTGSRAGLTAAQVADFEVAMYGPTTDKPYDWRTAGCHGRSVHVTGQDHAN